MITNEQNILNLTPAMRAVYKTKKARYEGFCQIIKKLESLEPCQTKHTFIFPVLTAWGEMSQDFTFIQEWMVKKFADNRLRHKSNDEGRSEMELRTRFRDRFRDNLCFALIKGNAMIATRAGVR